VLTEIADDVFVRQSAFCLSNAIVAGGSNGVLLIDPGVTGADLGELADDLDAMECRVAVGFATHPHWDHVLWHGRFGVAPRYATPVCVREAKAQAEKLRDMAAADAPGATAELIGEIIDLPGGSVHVPLEGRSIRVLEHRAHAPGHAALFLEDSHVLVAGDMLSDVEIPLLDPNGDHQGDEYLAALDLLEAACRVGVTAVVPGHGSVARGSEIGARIAQDRAYVRALMAGLDPTDRRVGPDATYGRDWLPAAHERNIRLVRQQSAGP
jgi:glyoxylase-like metal-dependent hydrolase (beta-lactamase superfamily II)